MLENPTQTAVADSAPVPKRYAPPNQRNRSLNRSKSGERVNRPNNSRNTPVIDYGDTGCSNLLNANSQSKLIPLAGFSRSEASQLLRDRWRAAMNCYNDPSIDLSERPVLYSSGASAWSEFRLPHQMLPPSNSTGHPAGTQTDFLAELGRKMQNSGASFDN